MNRLVGRPAPAFDVPALLPDGKLGRTSLAEHRGRWVLLVFYPLDFTFVCPTELRAVRDQLDAFKERKVVPIGFSTDSVYAHEAWTKGDLGPLGYLLASDGTHDVSRAYGLLIEDEGIALRGTVLIDPDGVVRSYAVNDLAVGRSIDEVIRTIDAFRTGELCPAGWKSGQKTLGKA